MRDWEKNYIWDGWRTSSGCGLILVKRAGMRDEDSPALPRPQTHLMQYVTTERQRLISWDLSCAECTLESPILISYRLEETEI